MSAVALALVLCAGCSASDGENTDAAGEPPPERPSGAADALTAVDPDTVTDLEEAGTSEDGDVGVDVSYPVVGGADAFGERLKEITDREVREFKAANPGAESIAIEGGLSAAGDRVLAVRLEQTEKDSEGERTSYSTYWYDTAEGTTAYSTQLLAGDEELADLHSEVAERLESDGVDTARLYPIARMYDSIGFNPDGDLVVEFDDGQLEPPGADRVRAVVPRETAEPLLSKAGERALAAATAVTRDFAVASGAPAPKDGAQTEVPGRPSTASDVDCTDPASKCVALTFDDGPGARTPELLDAFAEHDAKATFFVTGEPVREHPETVRREYAEGHEIANHTDAHPDLTTLGESGVREELAAVSGLVGRETGERPTLMRPPYGATDEGVADVTRDMGMAEIIWNVDTNDWRDHDASVVADRAVEGAAPGAIILMHDIHGTTVDAVPDILTRLDEEGFTPVTVSHLLNGTAEPGEKYLDGKGVLEKPEKDDPEKKEPEKKGGDGGN